MYYNTIYIGMDVHKESFTLCSFGIGMENPENALKTEPDYRQVLRYIESMRKVYGEECEFICGYEAGCLGYTLYHQLTNHNADCVILAPTTMPQATGKKKIKTDKRDAGNIAKCLAYRTYSPVHIPTDLDEKIKEFIRMRDDHKHQLKAIKQQILSFCLRHGLKCEESKTNWTIAHLKWLRSLELDPIYRETLSEYLITYDHLVSKLERFDERIQELASMDEYKENTKKLECFLGIRTHTALALLVEIGDFKRFQSAEKFSAYLGLVPGENSSGDNCQRLGITKAGNSHVRKLLTESAQAYNRGSIGKKSKGLKAKQKGNKPEVIAYADKANERLRRKHMKMILRGKNRNTVKTAIARELACFIWGMMTDNIG